MCLCLKCFFCLKVGRQITISHQLLNKIVASKQPTLAIFKSSYSVSMASPTRRYLPLKKNTERMNGKGRGGQNDGRVMAPAKLLFFS